MGDDETVRGTVFVEMDTDGEILIGIDTGRREVFVEDGAHYDDLSELDGENITATGLVWIDESGDRWIDLRRFDIADDD